MKRRSGFTLIEVLITMTIMVILVTLVTFSLRSVQGNARDEERKSDVTSIVRGLESYYDNGDSAHGTTPGHYPGRTQVDNAYTGSYATTTFLPGVSPASFQAPGFVGNRFYYGLPSAGQYTDAQARNGIATHPYLYQPLRSNNTKCDDAVADDCVKFNFYYLTEVDDTVHVIRSKHQ